MVFLRIQHSVREFDRWKRAFDEDPVDRRGGGVRRYQICRSVTDPNFVTIDLEFDRRDQAEGLLQKLRKMWEGPAKGVMQNPEAWVLETVEMKDV